MLQELLVRPRQPLLRLLRSQCFSSAVTGGDLEFAEHAHRQFIRRDARWRELQTLRRRPCRQTKSLALGE